LGAAQKNGLIEVRVHSFRDYGDGKHKTVDDSPFGGGPGMVFKPQPLIACLRDLKKLGAPGPVIGLTPQGVRLNNDVVRQLARFDRLILVCGRYEGFDDRILPEFDLELSIGDYVLSGGEFAAMVLVDAVARMIPGTVGRQESVEQDSFFDGLLDHPQYTRPSLWEGRSVPIPLMDGNHKRISAWRQGKALLRTIERRPDLFSRCALEKEQQECLQNALFE
jgi:tRNA (guanine37-N1)-methyltransferase